MATGSKFNQFVKDLGNKVHNLGSDVLKVALSNASPLNTNTVFSNIVEIAAGNGYAAGGNQATLVSANQVSGVFTLILNDAVFTASGGTIGPFRYAVLYNSTAAGSPLLAWWDYGSNVSITTGNSFATLFNSVSGVLTLQ